MNFMDEDENTMEKIYSTVISTKRMFTLIFLKRQQEILLGHKVRGLGKGYWNGFGGKLEQGESLVRCVKREVKEECNLVVPNPKHLGVVRYEVDNAEEVSIVHVFTSWNFSGREVPSEEMNPVRWFRYNEIPFKQMWPDAVEWYPLMLNEKYFSVHCIYNKEGQIRQNLIKHYDCLEKALDLAK